MQNRHRVVKIILKSIGAYFLYTIVDVARQQMVLEEARVIREQQVRFGGDFELSEQKKQVLNRAEVYLDNHAGYRLLNRMRTEQFFDQQFQKKIKQKEQALETADPEDKQQVQKLKSHLQQLNSAYKSVLPKMPSSWDDLRDKDEDEQD